MSDVKSNSTDDSHARSHGEMISNKINVEPKITLKRKAGYSTSKQGETEREKDKIMDIV